MTCARPSCQKKSRERDNMGNHTLIGQNKQCTESGGLQNATNKIRAEKDGDDDGNSAELTTVS